MAVLYCTARGDCFQFSSWNRGSKLHNESQMFVSQPPGAGKRIRPHEKACLFLREVNEGWKWRRVAHCNICAVSYYGERTTFNHSLIQKSGSQKLLPASVANKHQSQN
ncbi:hypothetical protein F2Q68_00011828 [Brassica cretica]|uniref:Uncharacterized protein n=1 Tax=Brassica cretica TaxID=69181 RepID=A0A8S9L1Z6_BRACR|nr:hypothetical protein F2Q68_00011828 [Brassica cretica]